MMQIMNKFVSSVAVATFLVANCANSAEVIIGPDSSFVALIGEIDGGAATQLIDLFVSRPAIKIVILDSPGGSVYSALDIALMVHRLGLNTYVPEDAYCASACSFIFLAGIERLVEGRLGVHQFYGAEGDAASVQSGAQYVVSSILDALRFLVSTGEFRKQC